MPIRAQNAYHGPIDNDLSATVALTRLAAGVVPDDIESLEDQLRQQHGSAGFLRAITTLGFRMRGTGAALTATSSDLGIQLLVYEAARDSEGVRTTIFAIDDARSHLAVRNLPPPIDLAEAELALGDSAAALTRLRSFANNATTMERTVSWGAVQNGWLLGRTYSLLGDLERIRGRAAQADSAYARAAAEGTDAGSRSMEPAAAGAVRLQPTDANSRVRYDAVLWMQPVFSISTEAPRPTVRITFTANEHRSAGADGGFTTTQTYDSIALDMPLLDRLGNDGLAIRRGIQASAGSLIAVTRTDSLEHTVSRTLSAATLPEELRKLLEHGVGFGPLSAAAPLPGHALAVGEQWSTTLQIDVPGAADPAPVIATYRLTRIATAGNRRLAFISIDAGNAAATAMSDGGKVQVRLTGELVRDCATGETLRLAASLRGMVWSPTGAQMPVRVLLTALRESGAGAPVLAMR
jgi:hypothetical protein